MKGPGPGTFKLGEIAEFLDYLRKPVSESERRSRTAGKSPAELYPYYGANGLAGWIDSYLFDEPLVLLAEDGGAFGSRTKPIAYKVTGKTWVNNHAHVLRPGPDVDIDYLMYALAIRPDVGNLVSGSTRGKLNQGTAAALPVTLPSFPEQRQVASQIDSQLEALKALRGSLLSQMASIGQLREAARRDFLEQLPDGRVKLNSIVRGPGAIVDGPFGSRLKGDHYKASGVRVIRLGNIGLGRFIDDAKAFVNHEHADALRSHDAKPGDVIIAALGDGARPAARACIVPSEFGPAVVKADCFRVRTEGSNLDSRFLMHVMNSPQMLAFVKGTTRGATRPRLNLSMLRSLEVPAVALEEQRHLVAKLDERLALLDDLDASVRAQQSAIDELPSAFLARAFRESGNPT